MEELLIELQVKDACQEDEVDNLSTIDALVVYYIAEDEIVLYDPTWSHTIDGCPFTY